MALNSRKALCVILALLFAVPVPALAADDDGIYVGEPKVYDDRSLQILLNAARASLLKLQPIDVGTLASHIGSVQGADVRQTQFALQVGTTPTTQNVTTTGSGTPSTVQGSGTTTVASATPSTTTSATSTTTTPSSTFQNVATQNSVSPSLPAVPGSGSVSLPSAYGTSALDTLNEEMQLNYEITNLQLLLEGSLSDRFIKGSRMVKRHSTIGFPISITAPNGDDYQNAVAEVQVTVANGRGAYDPTTSPSLTTILPREKTYNVASITDKSFGIGAGGVIAGLLSVGGSFFWGHRTYYLVKQQDTVALQMPPRPLIDRPASASGSYSGREGDEILSYWLVARFPSGLAVPYGPITVGGTRGASRLNNLNVVTLHWTQIDDAQAYDVIRSDSDRFPSKCSNCAVAVNLHATTFVDSGAMAGSSSTSSPPTTTFAWQFKPVLGQKTVAPGIRQTFAQLALPTGDELTVGCIGRVRVVTRWLRYDPKNNTTGDVIHEAAPVDYDIPNFDLKPIASGVRLEDLGNGSVVTTVSGEFAEGTHVRVGNVILDASNPQNFAITPTGIQFIASAHQLAVEDAVLVGRDGTENLILDPDPRVHADPVPLPKCVPQAPVADSVSGPADAFLFSSAPQGARFVVDNNPLLACDGACRMTLAPGPHNVVTTLLGFVTQTLNFSAPGAGVVTVNLEKARQIKLEDITIKPFNAMTSEVRIALDQAPTELDDAATLQGDRITGPLANPLLVTIGSKTFGLGDAPIELFKDDRNDGKWTIRLFASTADLATSHAVSVKRLYSGRYFNDSRDIKAQLDEPIDSEFSISKLDLLSSADPKKADSFTVFAITGSHLEDVEVLEPEGIDPEVLTASGSSTIAMIRLKAAQLQGLKQIVLRKKGGTPVILALPDEAKPKVTKATLAKHDPVSVGTTTLEVSGSGLDLVQSVRYTGKRLSTRLSGDKSKLVIDLPPELAASEGIRFLDIAYTDQTKDRYEVDVVAKRPQ